MLLQDPPFPLFLGTNVPWNKFGYDIGGGAWDRRWFESYFKSISGTQNTVRFFLHCDGRASPHFGEDGRVVGLARPEHGGAGTFSRELAELVALTRENRLVLQICLWSFDMCRSNGFPVRSNLIADPAISQSYVDNALQPFLESLDAAGCEHCMLEVINEPEWCIDDPKLDRCSAATCVSAAAMQRFVAMVTANIHGHSPQRKVTVGAASLKWSAPTANGRSVADLWTDSALIIAASTAHVENVGRPTIDLFNTHFWNWQERVDGYGPCNVDDASFWMASKPIVFAELPAHIHSHVDRHSAELLECILKRGFNGGLFWAYNDPGSLLEDAGATLTKATSTLPHEAASFEALMAYVRSPTPPHPLPPPPGPPPPRPGPPGMEQSPTPTDDQSYTPCSRVADCDVACPGSSYTFCWTYGLPTIGGVPHKAWQSVCWGQAHHLTCAGITNGKPPPDGAPGQCYSDVWRQYPCPAGRPTATLQTFPPAASFHAGPSCGYTYPPHPQPPPPRWPPPRPRVSPPAPQLGTPGGIFSPPDSAPPPRPVHEFVQWEPTTAGLPIIRTFAQMPVKAMGSITTTAGPVLHQYVSAPGYAPGSSGALVPLPSSAPPFVILAVIGSAVMCCAGFGVVVLSLVYRTGRAHGRRYDRAQTRDMEDEQG